MGKMTKTSAEVAQVAHRRAQEAYAEFQEGSRPVGEPNSLLPWEIDNGSHVPRRFGARPEKKGASRRSNRWPPMTRTAVCAMVALCLYAGHSDSQPSGEPSGLPDSYQYLSADAGALIDGYLMNKGLPRGSRGYHMLSESQRTTFESIIHALESEGHLGIVAEVIEIWGEMQGAAGVDQFRLSVILTPWAVDALLSQGYRRSLFGYGHVKLPSGAVQGRLDADSVRQPGRRPTLQISWLEEDRTVGDIDIDYRAMHEGHHHPSNSDIRAGIAGGETHHERHVEKFGYIQDWWRIP